MLVNAAAVEFCTTATPGEKGIGHTPGVGSMGEGSRALTFFSKRGPHDAAARKRWRLKHRPGRGRKSRRATEKGAANGGPDRLVDERRRSGFDRQLVGEDV